MEKRFEKRDTPTLYARASVDPKSINKEERTVWVTFATDRPVRMWSWEKGDFIEELDMSSSSVRMDRINMAGAVWDNHQYWEGTRGVVGKVVPGTATLEKGQARAQLRFSKKQKAEEVWQDIEDQIVTTVSVGYDVYKAERVRQDESGLMVYRATDWEPYEVSIAPMPADIYSQMRAKGQMHQTDVEVENTYQRDLDYIQTIQARYKNY